MKTKKKGGWRVYVATTIPYPAPTPHEASSYPQRPSAPLESTTTALMFSTSTNASTLTASKPVTVDATLQATKTPNPSTASRPTVPSAPSVMVTTQASKKVTQAQIPTTAAFFSVLEDPLLLAEKIRFDPERLEMISEMADYIEPQAASRRHRMRSPQFRADLLAPSLVSSPCSSSTVQNSKTPNNLVPGSFPLSSSLLR